MADTGTPRDVASGRRSLTDGQRRLLEKMPELADSVFPEFWDSIPASHYIDPARFEAEKRAVFRKVPVIAAPAALLAEPRSYAPVTIAGMPVLLTRDKDGAAHAFVNVCRHRGSTLCVAADPVRAPRIVCPYHAWTYGLDGSLVTVPRQNTFPGMDKADLSLVALPSREAGGLIWVGLDPDSTPDFSGIEGELAADLDALGLGAMQVFRKTVFPVRANWKLIMDSMLDSYHVTRLHKDSLARFFVDAENVVDRIGPHIRVAAARGNFERSRVSPYFEDVRRVMVFAYTPFPNGIIVVSPDFVSLGVVRPLATDASAVDYYMLTDAAPADEAAETRLDKSFALMEQAFGKEDYWAAEMCDQGLRSGTMPNVQLGGMEVQIRMFQDAVDDCLKRESIAGGD